MYRTQFQFRAAHVAACPPTTGRCRLSCVSHPRRPPYRTPPTPLSLTAPQLAKKPPLSRPMHAVAPLPLTPLASCLRAAEFAASRCNVMPPGGWAPPVATVPGASPMPHTCPSRHWVVPHGSARWWRPCRWGTFVCGDHQGLHPRHVARPARTPPRPWATMRSRSTWPWVK
jgi:hypothetical protein